MNTTTPWRSIITVTYPRQWQGDGEKVKADLNALLTALRIKLGGLRYLWFLEFQKRGAPHFHMLCDTDLGNDLNPLRGEGEATVWHNRALTKWLLDTWTRTIANRGCTSEYRLRISWEAIRDPEGGARYAAKYAAKVEQKTVPKAYQSVGRFWACDRCTSKLARETIELCADDLHALVGDEGVSKFGTWHKVQFGAAEKFRQLTRDCAKRLPDSGAVRTLQHAQDCVCPACMQFRRKAEATGIDGEVMERWDGAKFLIKDAFYKRPSPD